MKRLLETAKAKTVVNLLFLCVLATFVLPGSTQAVEISWPEPTWPEIFEPNQLLTLNLEIDPCDWDAICKDGLIWNDVNGVYEPNSSNPDPYGLEVPASFWADGEEGLEIRVAVRQKSCDPLGDANDRYFKISLKIDINEYYGVDPNAAPDWHDLKKLSLENGDDVDVVSEGLACNIHGMASGQEGYGYNAYRANWVELYVNGIYRGVYVNQEQKDKQFMKHHDYYIHSESWLYKHEGGYTFSLKVGDDEIPISPAVEALCYLPFASDDVLSPFSPLYPPDANGDPTGEICPTPTDANLVDSVNEWVNVQGLLSMGATNAFLANPDSLFTHYQNACFLDFNLPNPGETRKRMYFPWDQDSAIKTADFDIYNYKNTNWQQTILGNSTFRSQYNQIIRDLLGGPLSFDDVNDFLDTVEPVLTGALAADTYNQFDTPGAVGVAERFDQIRLWVSDRIANVLAQVDIDEPVLPPGIVLLNDGFEGAVWDANWTNTGWAKGTTEYLRGSASAHADKNNYGDFTCNALDAGDATAIHINFGIQKNNITSYNPELRYYDGTTYNLVTYIDTLGGDDEWLRYADTITDSNYFIPDFHIKFSATLSGGGPARDIWVDDVVITKETPMMICGYILDPGATPIDGVLVDANNAGGSDTTDLVGYYEAEVPFNWSGTVTPTKIGYTFDPASRIYDVSVTEDQINQDYTAIVNTYTISGSVGLADVNMVGLGVMSDGSGNYIATVDYDWSGTVTPTKTGYTFSPASRNYSNVAEDHIGDDYTPTLNTYAISGQILDPNNQPIAGVFVDANNGGGSDSTDPNGEYSIMVNHGWFGTVTPTKADYTFEPNSITYVNVTADQTGQDYVGTSIYDLMADGYINVKDVEVFAAAWLSSQGDGNWNAACDFYYDLTVNSLDFGVFANVWED